MKQNILSSLRAELKKNADQKLQQSGQHFFKEKVKMYGMKTTLCTQIGKKYFLQIKHLPKKEIFTLCESLWRSEMMEETFIACNWSYNLHKQFTPNDFQIFTRWVEKYINNWASCDTFCNHTVGTFIEMYPDYVKELIKWTHSKNRWVKRASAVSLIIPAKKGLFLQEILAIADNLLSDKDDLVQKGYGWMLKAASQAYENKVFEYVLSKKTIMPRTALRYAIEKMNPNFKRQAMQK